MSDLEICDADYASSYIWALQKLFKWPLTRILDHAEETKVKAIYDNDGLTIEACDVVIAQLKRQGVGR